MLNFSFFCRITNGTKLRFRLKGLEIMNDDPTEVDILYAKCIFEDGNRLVQQIADLTAQRFAGTGTYSNHETGNKGLFYKLEFYFGQDLQKLTGLKL